MHYSNFLVKLIQAQNQHYKELVIPKTKLIVKLVKKLTKHGYLYGYKPIQLNQPTYQQSYIKIYLKYYYEVGVLTCLTKYQHYRLFKYISYKHLLSLKNFSPILFLQSPHGIITQQEAITQKIGGRIILICI